MAYFAKCKTAEELKNLYRQTCKRLHPDNGGNADAFKDMQVEFSAAWERLKNVHVNKDGEMYTKDTDESADEFMDLINELMKMRGVNVELCGSWLWCTGSTLPYRDKFRELKFAWSRNKQAWYFHRGEYHKRGKRKMSLDDIRTMYGSKKIEREDQAYLPA